ncbi:DUF4097 family beta strand repeat-containing protein [Paenibacillus sp. KN14-4R]|uniref:DUF4097 family beta strand repeat-containing protein n=1 Tax=Paenibacillus sp. KN14-4R TaxID=3445773 RepID=UPI003FA0C351
MNKKILGLGLILIAIGLIGAYNFGITNGNNNNLTFQKKWNLAGDPLKELKLHASSGDLDVVFVQSQDGSNSIEMNGTTKQDNIDLIEAAVPVNGEFKLDFSKKEKWNLFSFGPFSDNKIKVTVALTDLTPIQVVDIQTSSGNITGANLLANKVDIHATSGDIELAGVHGQEIKLKSTSGNISASKAEGPISAEIHSGNIELNDVTDSAIITSTSGNVKLTQKKAANADIKVTSGDAKVTVPKDFGGSFDLRATSGNISAPDEKHTSQEVIKVRTTAGNITVKQ